AAPDWPALTENLGESWGLLQNTYKPYPAGIVVHPVIDAVLDLRAQHAVAPEAVARILIRGNPLLVARADRPDIATGREAQVSVQHSAAAALIEAVWALDRAEDAS